MADVIGLVSRVFAELTSHLVNYAACTKLPFQQLTHGLVFRPGLWLIGFRKARSGSDVQNLQMYP